MSVSISGAGSISGLDQGFNVTSGNLGIGTDNPDATLKVNVASGNNGVVVQNTSTANIALLGARNGDATVQIGQWGSTASGSTFGLSNADLSFIYTTSYSTTHPSALALGTVSNKPIVFATNNTERLRIDSSGQLGIGIASPGAMLHAYHATTNTIAQFQSGDAGAGILLKDNTHYTRLESTNGTFKIDVDAGQQIGSEVMSFQMSGSERLRITSGGQSKFTVGTNKYVKIYAASHNDEADLGAGIAFSRPSDGADMLSGMFAHSNTGLGIAARDHITFLTGGTSNVSDTEERLRIDSSGNLLLKTGEIDIQGGNKTVKTSAGFLQLGTSGSHHTSIITAGSERLRVDSSGRLMVGTTSPGPTAGKQLTIADSANAGITIRSGTNAAGAILFEDDTADRGEIQYSHNGDYMRFKTAGTERMRIDSSGNVNIGSNASFNPFTYLRFGASQYGAADIRPTNEGSHKVGLSFYTDGTQDTTINPTEAMRLDSSGHLQIRREGVASMSGVDTRHTRYVIRQTNGQEAILGSVFAQGKSGWGGDLVFASKSATGSPSTGLTERMRLLAGGGITFNGDTAAANALDDYEEGSWTPASHNNFNNISSPEGRYIKVGKLVTVNFQFNYGSLNSATAASGIDGLPYSVANDNSLTGVEATGIGFGTNKDVIIWGEGGADIIYFKVGSPLNGSTSSGADFFRGSLTYLTD
tara:strand:+ start:1883 stop:3982 length:2100 start_codon:yes stop_codon:yes gene_type:complete